MHVLLVIFHQPRGCGRTPNNTPYSQPSLGVKEKHQQDTRIKHRQASRGSHPPACRGFMEQRAESFRACRLCKVEDLPTAHLPPAAHRRSDRDDPPVDLTAIASARLSGCDGGKIQSPARILIAKRHASVGSVKTLVGRCHLLLVIGKVSVACVALQVFHYL
jgi:hypothetical protein